MEYAIFTQRAPSRGIWAVNTKGKCYSIKPTDPRSLLEHLFSLLKRRIIYSFSQIDT